MSDGFELDEMKEIIDSFIVEVAEHIDNLDQNLVELEDRPTDFDLLNKIFRAAHTIKGAASFLDFDLMAKVTHHTESVLDALRKDKLKVTPEIMDIVLESIDFIKMIFTHIRENYQEDSSVDISDITARLDNIMKNQAAASQSSDSAEQKSDQKSTQTAEQEESTTEPPPVPAQKEVELPSPETVAQKPAAEPGPAKPEPAPAKAAEPPQTKKTAPEPPKPQIDKKNLDAVQTIRVDLKRIDNVMNLVQELVPGRNRLVQINKIFKEKLAESHRDFEETIKDKADIQTENMKAFNANLKKFNDEVLQLSEIYDEVTAQIDLVTTELQLAVMKTRMLPIANVFNKFPRMVRDLSREIGKEIKLEMNGKETELDKSVIEIIGDPLMHCIRNSVDHAIEFPEERERLGKPKVGIISLSAFHEGNYIVVTIEDDGKGMDAEKLRSRAIEKGVYTPEEAQSIGDKDILNVIFHPGFSTAEKVTNVSGRGVGMDVLKTNIEKLNGIIDVDTEIGQGSMVTIKIPLTLAIIQALLIKIHEEIYAIPLASVIETVRISNKDINTIKNKQVYRLRDAILPLLSLSEVFDLEKKFDTEKHELIYVVVLGIAEKRIGLVVDNLLGQEEVVVKSIGDFFEETPGIAGATIMGDGRVRLIVNVSDLVEIVDKKNI